MSFPVRRTIEFIYSATVAYVLVFEEYYIRVFYGGALITTVASPYLEEHLFELQYRQVGDVMRIVHPKYAPRKLLRTSASSFTLSEIEFKDGPFLVRNDLKDPYETEPAEMNCTATTPGSFGTLTCTSDVFNVLHVGCLFRLTHERTTTTASAEGATSSGTMYVKGSFRFITRGTWTGTIYVKRRENGGDWEKFRTYKGSSGAEQNVSWTLKEESDNVEYYIDSTTGPASGGFRAELSCDDTFHSGVIKVLAYGGPKVVPIEVISRIESTSATRRWAEGSWSGFRGYPASITFFENRCIYAGALSASDASESEIPGYPILKRANYGGA
jgi:hypothetical protein